MSKLEPEDIKESLELVHVKILCAMEKRLDYQKHKTPTLVAVSKTKPIEMILEAYAEGQRHFGENYVQELISKANDPQILGECPDIKWHLIGHLQSNKAAKVVSLPNLYIIETVDSKKLATMLNDVTKKQNRTEPLNIFVQVNTSSEEEKSGVLPDQCVDLCQYVVNDCQYLKFCGLMTIGKYGYDVSQGPNPDFLKLIDCRNAVCEELNYPIISVELSMGMSDDFEQAVELGSTNIRVGSAIFGHRSSKEPS